MNPEEIMLSGRATGRTSRMLAKAVELAVQGKAVYVLCAGQKEKIINKRLLMEQVGERNPITNSIKFETWESLGRNNVDLENSRLRFAHPNCQLLIDHQFFSTHFSFAILGYHLYDKEKTSSVNWVEKDWGK